MSYLMTYLARPARVDAKVRLNRPGLYGDAYVRVFVEDTSRKRGRRGEPPEPRIKLRVADCFHVATLEFDLLTPEYRENALFKIDTLLAELTKFREALAEEIALYEQRALDRYTHDRP